MKKTTNVIVRVDPELKAQAEEACAYLDMTLSQLLRRTMQSAVRQYQQAKANDTAYARALMEGEHAQLAYDALKRELQAKGGAVDVVTRPDGGTELQPSEQKPEDYRPVDAGKGMTPRLSAEGAIDPSTMSRKLRRQYARDRKKGRV